MKVLKTTIRRQLQFAHLYLLFRGRHRQGYTKFVLLVHGGKFFEEKFDVS